MQVILYIRPEDRLVYEKGDPIRAVSHGDQPALEDKSRANPLQVIFHADEIVDVGVHEGKGMDRGTYRYYLIQKQGM